MNLVLLLGIMILAGFLGGALASKLGFPKITGYLVAGVFLNPSISDFVPPASLDYLNNIAPVVLGMISYHIGGSLHLASLRAVGKTIASISIFQSLTPWFLTILLVFVFGHLFMGIPNATTYNTYLPMGLVLGAIATASAPAAIVAIIQECKAYGPVTTTVLATLAITDAIAVLAFAVALGVAVPMVNGATVFSLKGMLLPPLLHIGKSILIGGTLGLFLSVVTRLADKKSLLLIVILAVIFLCIGISEHVHASPLFANMVLGFVAVNLVHERALLHISEEIWEIVFPVFFVINGMNFDFANLKEAGILTLLVVIGRWGGKYCGAWFGARISGASEEMRRYTGLVLLPKAGITLGLAFIAKDSLTSFGHIVFNALIVSTIINMLITPPLAKFALVKSGETHDDNKCPV